MNSKTCLADYLSDYRRENVRGIGTAKRLQRKFGLEPDQVATAPNPLLGRN
jgi:aldose 1-epimerase